MTRRMLIASVGLWLVTRRRTRRPDRSTPPTGMRGAGAFTARKLWGSPVIDGQRWVTANVQIGPAPAVLRAPNGHFTLTLADAGSDTGDFERYQVLFADAARPPVRIDSRFSGWAYITPDSRYVITEPLFVLDVLAWQQYALHDALAIQNYTSIEAISSDSRRLPVSRRDCAMDCREASAEHEYYVLALP
jgi:hypothetical protein